MQVRHIHALVCYITTLMSTYVLNLRLTCKQTRGHTHLFLKLSMVLSSQKLLMHTGSYRTVSDDSNDPQRDLSGNRNANIVMQKSMKMV